MCQCCPAYQMVTGEPGMDDGQHNNIMLPDPHWASSLLDPGLNFLQTRARTSHCPMSPDHRGEYFTETKTFTDASTNLEHTLILNVCQEFVVVTWNQNILPLMMSAWASRLASLGLLCRLFPYIPPSWHPGPGPQLWCHVLSGQERAPSLPCIRSGLRTLGDNTTQSDLSPLCSGFNLQLALGSPPPIPLLSFCSNKLGSPVSPVSLKTLNFNYLSNLNKKNS